MDLLVVGDANPDLVLRGGDIVPTFGQREQLVDHAELVLGGSGGDLRRGRRAARARASRWSACVGDDALGRFTLDALRAAGVDVGARRHRPRRGRPASASPSPARDDRAVLTAAGALAAPDAPRTCRTSCSRRARHVHVASPFLQAGLAPGLRVAGRPRPRRARSTPAGTRARIGTCRSTRSTSCCRTPRRRSGWPAAPTATSRRRRCDLAARGPLVVVKLGADGALAADGTELTRVPAPRVDAVDSTGAGDSFDAGFLAARLLGEDLERRARAGVRVRRAEHARAPAATAAQPDARRGPQRCDDRLRRGVSVGRPRCTGSRRSRPGAIHRPDQVVAVPGGKALNAARAAHSLGAR